MIVAQGGRNTRNLMLSKRQCHGCILETCFCVLSALLTIE